MIIYRFYLKKKWQLIWKFNLRFDILKKKPQKFGKLVKIYLKKTIYSSD